jgi:hypothetical protein
MGQSIGAPSRFQNYQCKLSNDVHLQQIFRILADLIRKMPLNLSPASGNSVFPAFIGKYLLLDLRSEIARPKKIS